MKNTVPRALKNWFIVHFILDLLFAIPLFLFPDSFLSLLGWEVVDPVTARMVAAALFGIGIESLISRNATADSYRTMLMLKMIWSLASVTGITIGLISGSFGIFLTGCFLLAIFVGFNILWTYWYIYLTRPVKS